MTPYGSYIDMEIECVKTPWVSRYMKKIMLCLGH